jgi:hypothetical protein
MDVPCLYRDFGIVLQSVFDTQKGASALGMERCGLSSVLEKWECPLSSEITENKKEMKKTDWRIRPLTPAMARYAILDVHYLIATYRIEICELTRLRGVQASAKARNRARRRDKRPAAAEDHSEDITSKYLSQEEEDEEGNKKEKEEKGKDKLEEIHLKCDEDEDNRGLVVFNAAMEDPHDDIVAVEDEEEEDEDNDEEEGDGMDGLDDNENDDEDDEDMWEGWGEDATIGSREGVASTTQMIGSVCVDEVEDPLRTIDEVKVNSSQIDLVSNTNTNVDVHELVLDTKSKSSLGLKLGSILVALLSVYIGLHAWCIALDTNYCPLPLTLQLPVVYNRHDKYDYKSNIKECKSSEECLNNHNTKIHSTQKSSKYRIRELSLFGRSKI